jgi:outer membrane protein TolC
VPDDAILSSIQAAPLQERYDLTALGLRAEAATDTHRGASKWWVPSISLLGEFVAFHAQATTISAYALGLSLSWSVFDGLTSYARSKEELAQERIALRTEDKAKLQARTDFQTYRRRYRYNLQKYRSRVDDVHRSEESVRLARQGFKAGTQTSTNVLDAEQDLFNARASLVEAQYGAFESLIRFELAVGRNVTQ